MPPVDDWYLDDWMHHRDRTQRASRQYLPDAGGWLYQFNNPNGVVSHAFVPQLSVWANAIGQAVVQAQHADDPKTLGLQLDRARDVPQPRPARPGRKA